MAHPPIRPSLAWDDGCITAVDQRALPTEHRSLRLCSVDEVIEAITSLAVRGAPAIGLAGALGVALSADRHRTQDGTDEQAVRTDAQRMVSARPTAVNLARAVERALKRLPEGAGAVLAEAQAMLAEDIEVNQAAVDRAARLVTELCPGRPLRILTHCNTGRLATAAVGTALGTILHLARAGCVEEVLVGETRPLLQGARLTAWELAEAGVPHRLCTDSAGPAALGRGMADCVLVGADRVTANGDVANKIGTYSLAVAAARHRIPFVVVAPESSWDHTLPNGSGIVIEERDRAEVTAFAGTPTTPLGTRAYNPAFDVTPAELITAIVTERRTVRPAPPSGPEAELAELCRELYQRGWMPGTAGNISVRTPAAENEQALITPSGRGKGTLRAADMVRIQATTGRPARTGGPKPSAETAIHAAIYRRTDADAVIHVHSPYATTVATRHARADQAGSVRLEGHELLKGLGLADPTGTSVPVFVNWPDVDRIAADVDHHLAAHPAPAPALLIAEHGITVWGRDLAQAKDRLECLEAIFHLLLLAGTGPAPAL
ncbi:S-methyl-5-thioribose-1-phosphate isomerase [Streptomyces sioyaensis]|uniref:S-methyl-5-thioribose-1-phosphate isomerase n=1 Tax=Streptomyces sioyaensis TaxID=67364 RepID=UPI0033F4893E